MDDAAPTKHVGGGESVLQKVQTPFSTPSKTTINRSLIDEENRTPNTMPHTTPSTMLIPMQTALTPYVGTAATVKVVPKEEVEYSFEERRAGFVLPNASI